MTNFNYEIDLTRGFIDTTYLGKKLILNNIRIYQGPITMQYLPYGGIQSTYGGLIILNTKNGFIASDEVIYDGNKMSSEEFITLFPHLVNSVLPS